MAAAGVPTNGVVIFDFYVDTIVAEGSSRADGLPVLALPRGCYEGAGAIFFVNHDRFSTGSTKADFDECASRAMFAMAFGPVLPEVTTFELMGSVLEGSDEHRRRIDVGFFTRKIGGAHVQVFKLPAGDYSIGHRAFRIASRAS
jgi:hypothetical protein